MEAGIPRIEISCGLSDLTEQVIIDNLPDIFTKYKANANKIRSLRKDYLLNHSILSKTRPHGDSQTNNVIVEPHTYAMVNFKVGYAYGNPIKYSQTKEIDDDSIRSLNICDNEVFSRSVDSEVANWVYSTGIGYYFIVPNGNIAEEESPYTLCCVESDMCSKVYSSMVGHEELFDCIFSVEEKKRTLSEEDKKRTYVAEVYTRDKYYKFNMESGVMVPMRMVVLDRPDNYHMLPLVQKSANSSCVGIVELVKSMQYSLDYITSNNLDNISDIVNMIFVYKNVNLGKDATEQGANHRAFIKNGAIVLNSKDPNFPADVVTLVNKLDFTGIQKIYDNLKQEMYDIAGVPLASTSVSSGGDTGSARSLGNGWENAYNILLGEINQFLVADRQLLNRKIAILKGSVAFGKSFSVSSNDIAIKYNPNITDNMLTKSQSYVNFITNGMPPKMALAKSQLSNDPEAEGKEISDYSKQNISQDTANNGGGSNMNNEPTG